MTAALEGGEWSAARPGHTLPPGKTRYPFHRRLGGPQGRSGRAENLVPTGIRSRTVQPIVSRYTDPIQWVPGFFPRGKAAEVWSWLLTSTYHQGQEWVELYFSSPPTCLHGKDGNINSYKRSQASQQPSFHKHVCSGAAHLSDDLSGPQPVCWSIGSGYNTCCTQGMNMACSALQKCFGNY